MRLLAPTLAFTLAVSLAACSGSDDATPGESGAALVLYSGRSEELVAPILEQMSTAIGVEVEIRYASSSELAAQLLEEGEATDADLFFSQDAGALGALAKAGRLAPLDEATVSEVKAEYRDDGGRWAPTSARARVLAYDPAAVPGIDQIDQIDDILDPAYAGQIAFAPTNASFHAFVTALRVDKGEDGARAWLEAFAALDPQAFDSNNAVLAAVDDGQAALGLINHYYWYQQVAELGADGVNAKIHFLDNNDPGALVNVAGVGVLEGTDQAEAAADAVDYLLSDTAQQYFADKTAEYPVVDGITSTEHDLAPLGESSDVDLNDLDSLEQTLALLDEVGLT